MTLKSRWKTYTRKRRIVLIFLTLALGSSIIFVCLQSNFTINPFGLEMTRGEIKSFQPESTPRFQNYQHIQPDRLVIKPHTPSWIRTTETPGIAKKTSHEDPRIHTWNITAYDTKSQVFIEPPDGRNLKTDPQNFSSPYIVSSLDDENPKSTKLPFINNSKVFLFSLFMPCARNKTNCFIKQHDTFHRCYYNNCITTDDMSKAHVVSFYVFRIREEKSIPQFTRPLGQIWIMRTPEAACRQNYYDMLDFPRLKGQFNWTFTYRLDSDYPVLYGKLRRLQKPPVKNYQSIYNGKKYNSAWFVSHCVTQSKRMIYVERMMNIVDVHIYGACGDKNCSDPAGRNPRTSDEDVCFPLLSKNYFFYLAFENSLCKDYVTEKLFKMYKNVDIIPVVRGGVDYHKNFPPDTFVDASDFDSPEKLSEYLVGLAKNKTRYIQMLKAKNDYRLENTPRHRILCEICERLNSNIEPKTYPDLKDWFVKDQCHNPHDL